VTGGPEDCLFCQLVAEGSCIRRSDGFVAVEDLEPQAEVHVLIVPERHVATFREIGVFPAEEVKRMLSFIAETAAELGLHNYRVLCNVGPGAGQRIFHLHWHLMAGRELSPQRPALALAEADREE
jgi:histidine triad (HIT) family protein